MYLIFSIKISLISVRPVCVLICSIGPMEEIRPITSEKERKRKMMCIFSLGGEEILV